MIPEKVREADQPCRKAAAIACGSRTSVVHPIYRDRARVGRLKACQFGRVSMREHWHCGLADISRALEHPGWLSLPEGDDPFVTHDASAPGEDRQTDQN